MAKTPKTDDDKTPEAPENEVRPGDGDESGVESAEAGLSGSDVPDDGAPEARSDTGPAEAPEPAGSPEVADPPEPEPKFAHVEPDPLPVTVPPRRGGMSAVLGGVIAALLGAGALWLAASQDWVRLGGPDTELLDRIATLEADIAAAETAMGEAEAEIAALREAEPDLSAVTAAIEDTAGAARTASGENAAAIAALTERLDSTDERLQTVAVQQIPEAELPQAISDAYDAKLADLLATIDERFAAMQAGLNTKLSEIETSQAAAAEAEAAAQAAARRAEARAAAALVRTSLEDGTAFAEPLDRVSANSDVEIPAILAETAETGIATVDGLAEAFPAAARRALTVSSAAAVDAGTLSRFEAFLRTQAGARSLAPREGDDPDAVLSRAEAAASRGDLETAIAELDALPEEGQAAMADWVERAETRIAALAAAADLAAQVEQN